MNTENVRVRFAPAPTGIMHIGNIRTALINYLFARQKNGTLVLRIEDTDQQRNYDPNAEQIIADLQWMNLTYDEGPGKEGKYGPYFQSQRAAFYAEKLQELIERKAIYRCFCTEQDLEKKRQRQRALGLPPRYDRVCDKLSQTEIEAKLQKGEPFIWRIRINHDSVVEISDIARGKVRFEMRHFSDFALTRTDGSFTFMFANFVDDLTMNITHVFRGEDHLSNTASQSALFAAFNAPLPTYWHVPMLFNTAGQKLSKRDFGFSLNDLRQAGFLPEAICNYLAILGGSFEQEIMSLPEIVHAINFEAQNPTGQIKYDVQKLTWINRQWIARYSNEQLLQKCLPLILQAYPQAKNLSMEQLIALLSTIKPELQTITDCVPLLAFYFAKPTLTQADVVACIEKQFAAPLKQTILDALPLVKQPTEFVATIKQEAKKQNIPLQQFFWFLRLALMGSTKGFGIHELIEMLQPDEAQKRIEIALNLL